MTQPSPTYSELTRWRGEAARFGAPLDLPVTPSQYGLLRSLDRGGLVLDVGAGVQHHLKEAMKLDDARYRSLDSDPAGRFDYASFADIPAGTTFSLITMLQLLEHLTIEAAHTMVCEARRVLAPDGLLVISVPNAMHPVRFSADVTHVTNWPASDLYGLLRHAGYRVHHLYRCNKHPLTRHPIRRWVVRAVCREFRMDWCDTIILIAGHDADE